MMALASAANVPGIREHGRSPRGRTAASPAPGECSRPTERAGSGYAGLVEPRRSTRTRRAPYPDGTTTHGRPTRSEVSRVAALADRRCARRAGRIRVRPARRDDAPLSHLPG